MKTPTPKFQSPLHVMPAFPACGIASLFAGAAILGTPLHAVTWTGSVSTDWNLAANWGGIAPVNTFARIDIAAPTATISSNFAGTPSFIVIGNGAGSNGRVDHVAGTGATAASQDIQIARSGGTGTYNLANTAAGGGALTGFGQGSGTMSVLRHLYVGGFTSGAASIGTLNLHTSGTLAITSQLLVGNSGSTGTVRIDSGTLTVGDAFEIGNGPGTTGTFSMSGGTVTKTGTAAVTIGGGLAADGGNGTANLNGGTFTTAGVFRVGQDSNTASAAVSTGTLNLGGTNLTVNGEFWIGNNTGATGTMVFTSGSLVTNNWALVGRKDDTNAGAGATGSVTMSGGIWTKTGDSNFVVGDTGNGTMTQSGGTVTVVASNAADRGITWIGNRNSCTGQLTLSGSAEFNSPRIVLAVQPGTTGSLDLNGGTVRTSQLLGGDGNASVTFNGSQIVATGGSANFIGQLDTATIGTGGLKVDSNGFNLTAPQALAGSGGVVKSGAGTLALTGANTHTGNHSVLGGTLSLSSDFAGSGTITVADGAGFGAVQLAGGSSLVVSDLTLGSAGDTSLSIDLGNSPGNPTAAALDVDGVLTLAGTVTVNIADASPVEGPAFPILTYNAPKAGAGTFVLGDLPDGVSAVLVDDGNGLVTLEITNVSLPRWSGAVNGVWDSVTENWTDILTFTPTTYLDPAPVIFNDSAGGTTDIVLDLPVTPGSVLFDAGTKVYTLNGTGGIGGSTGLTKLGAANLTLNTANTYTGPTVLSGGTTSINSVADAGSPSSIGSAAASPSNLVFNGGSLQYTGPSASTNRGFSVNAVATTITNASDLEFGGQVASTGGNLVKQGAGNLTFSHTGNNVLGTVANGVLVHAGTLTLRGSGTQTNTVAGEMWVADLPDSPADLVLIDTTLTTASWLAIGRGNGNDGVTHLTATGSTINSVNYSTGYNNGLPNNASEAFVTLNNSVWNNNGLTYLAESTGSTATMTLNGNSQYNISNNFLLARFSGTTATFNLNDNSSVTKTGGYVAIGNEGNAVMNMGGNSSFTAATGDFNIGDVGNSNGTLNLGGTALVNVANVYIGKNVTTTGTLNQTGGTFQSSNFITIGAFSGGTGLVDISAGTLTAGTVINVGQSGTGTLTVSGSAQVTANGDGVVVGSAAGGIGSLNLNGGTVTARRVFENTGGFSTLNFNGGLLKAAAGASATFVGPVDTAIIQPGGAFIDTNGQNLSVTAAFAGPGPLAKSGAGTLTLSGIHSYGGNTTVSAGTLSVNSAFFADSSTIQIAAGAVLNLNHVATDTVAGLVIGGSSLPAGTYDATSHPGILTGGGKLQVTGTGSSPYDTWIAVFPSIAPADRDPGDDPDKDGHTNAMEFVLGGIPNQSGNWPKVYPLVADSSDAGTNREMLLTIAVRVGTPAFAGSPSSSATHEGYTCTVQGSTALGAFTTGVTPVSPVTAGLPAAPAGYEYRSFSLAGSDGLPSKGFLRVNVTP